MNPAPAITEPVPPQAVILRMVAGARITKVISDVTRLGVPDVLKQFGSMTAAQMVHDHGIVAAPEALHRALRVCAALGIFSEDAAGRFGPTELSEVLTSDAPGSVKKMVHLNGILTWKVWTGLPDALRTGLPQSRNQLGMEFFEYLAANPDEMNEFAQAMESNSVPAIKGLIEKYDFTGIERVVDVGGGFGHLVVALLAHYPKLHGVLLERPEMISLTKDRLETSDMSLKSRLECIVGDMFESVPAAEVYVLKMIMHDWTDRQCIQILRNCRTSMTGDGRILCVDAVVPPLGDPSDPMTKLLDLNMMLVLPGKERTKAEWQDLYEKAGLKIRRIIPVMDGVSTSIIEGVKAS